jgi:hypothetical protein
MEKSLDRKIERILADPGCNDFILADAKDADMGLGLAAPGVNRGEDSDRYPYRTMDQYRQAIREVTAQGLVDIMLMSASSSEVLTIQERLFDDSPVTPAARVNDTTDIWLGQTGSYRHDPSMPFRTATIDQVQGGCYPCSPEQRSLGADLGLYSITFNNDTLLDREGLEQYRAFRLEAEEKNFRHFLEIFAPNAPGQNVPEDVGRFVNDSICRTLAGVVSSSRPLFLKIPYFGPAAMEQLVAYDRSVIVGILGGPAGTTHDAFRMLWEAKKYGGRAALFGRKINQAEDPLLFVEILRALADGEADPEESVRDYHGQLKQRGITPHRPLEEDLVLTQLDAS